MKKVKLFFSIFILIMVFSLMIPFTKLTVKADKVNITTSAALIKFIKDYNYKGLYADDVDVELALSSGTLFDLSTDVGTEDQPFVGLGTDSRPFKGNIVIGDAANNKIKVFTPLFGTITSDVKIINNSGSTRQIVIVRSKTKGTGVNNDFNTIENPVYVPLFAEKIIAGINNIGTTYNIRIEKDDTDSLNQKACDFEGLIERIDNNCKVEVNVTFASKTDSQVAKVSGDSNLGFIANNVGNNVELTTSIAVSSSPVITSSDYPVVTTTAGNVGALVGSMGTNCTLNVNSDKTYTSEITTSNGAAGGLVGVMGDSSEIVFSSDYESCSTINGKSSAGGLVGDATNVDITTSNNITINKAITATTSAGALYGTYKSTGTDRSFDLSPIITDLSTCIITSNTNAGGIIGFLDAENNVTIDGNITLGNSDDNNYVRGIRLVTASAMGGIIGLYKNNNLANTLLIKNNKVAVKGEDKDGSGGLIGKISSEHEAYIKIQDVVVNSSENTLGGGLIGSSASKGHFIDISGLVSLRGNFASGLVNYSDNGIIRIQGITDLGLYYTSTSASTYRAQLIGTRNNTLVYALGSGNDNNWKFYRAPNSTRRDDIADWGEVLRLSSESTLSETDFFTVDNTNHIVTVKAASTTITTLVDFVKLALNMSLNNGNHEALKFSGSNSSTLLSSTINLNTDINLNHTGILGLTKDNGTNGVFSGTFNGNDHTITFSIGEDYSANSVTTNTEADNRAAGAIMTHTHNGLFAKIGSNATIQNLTVAGTMNFVLNTATMYVGPIAAEAIGSFTLDDLTLNTTINFSSIHGNSANIGGAIGRLTGNSNDSPVSITDSTLQSIFNMKHLDSNGWDFVGGLIGCVNHSTNKTFILNIDNLELESTFAPQSVSNNANVKYGGLISRFLSISGYDAENDSYSLDNSTVNLTNIKVLGERITSYAANETRNTGHGGLLGYNWPDTDVVMGTFDSTNGIIIGTTSDAANSPLITIKSGYNLGSLVYKGTGHWIINHIKVNKFDIDNQVNNNNASFGFIVNETIDENSALFLELNDETYDISNLNISGTYKIFDEIATYTYKSGTDISDNGQSVISIRTTGGAKLSMDGANCNTYQNRTTYGKTSSYKYNSFARYYYNLDSILSKSVGNLKANEKLLLWSLSIYQHDYLNRRNIFVNPFNGALVEVSSSDTFDMDGISYYPINYNGDLNIGDCTIKFYNNEIFNSESGTGNSDSYARSNRSSAQGDRTQHHLMHQGLLLNYLGNLTISGDVVFKGNVYQGRVKDNTAKSGFLICGTLGGENAYPTTFSSADGSITFDNAEIINASATSPLLIYTIQSYTTCSFNNITTANYGTVTTTKASSLIGNVGSATANNISLYFTHIALDARKTSGIPSTSSELDATYGTNKSIFSQATLLLSFRYLSSSYATYVFEEAEGVEAVDGKYHHITYGYELSNSVEYSGKEDKYHNSDVYVNPTRANEAYSYSSSNYLRYVKVEYNYNSDATYHEIAVNLATADFESGCGRYNDPYIIAEGTQFETLAEVLYGTIPSGFKINLPTNDISGEGVNGVWCNDNDAVYEYDGSSYFTSAGKTTRTADAVRQYLAGAYYQVKSAAGTLTIANTYMGLGTNTVDFGSYSSAYAFRGVIVGYGSQTIINKSQNPFITRANGCVLKDLIIKADSDTPISLSGNFGSNITAKDLAGKFQYANGACQSYGAVIGQVMGGDNIIDNVGVQFGTNNKISVSGTFSRLIPIGGYIGVVLNGGVIFRTMTDNPNKIGLTTTQFSQLNINPDNENTSLDVYLYANPIIGRVIAGYAFTESTTYRYNESNVTMKNGIKNYSIPDLKSEISEDDKIDVTATSNSTHQITLAKAGSGETEYSGQFLYLLACIINTGAASASYNDNTEQAYDTNTTTPWFAYRNYTSTRNGNYQNVGKSTDTEKAVVTADKYQGTTKIPYIIKHYTKQNTLYRIRSIANGANIDNVTVSLLTLTSGANYYLPASFKGIGTIYYSYFGNMANKSSSALKLNITISKLEGNNANIIFSTHYQEYDGANAGNEDANSAVSNDSIRKNENYGAAFNTGLGLFTQLKQPVTGENDTTNVIQNINLQGSIYHEVRVQETGKKVTYKWRTGKNADGVGFDHIMSVGGIAGCVFSSSQNAGSTDKYSTFNLKNITLDGVNFESPKATGGLLGFVPRCGDNHYTYNRRFITNCGSGSGKPITIKAGTSAGGLIGFILRTSCVINGNTVENPTTLKIKEVVSKATTHDGESNTKGKWWLGKDNVYAAGGLIGMCDVAHRNKLAAFLVVNNYKVVGDGDSSHNHIYSKAVAMTAYSCAGGLIGMSKATNQDIDDVIIEGLNMNACYAGGYFGRANADAANVKLLVDNFTVDGYIDGENKYSITATKSASGLFGYYEKSQALTFNLNKINVKNYNIESTYKANDTHTFNVGGIMGTWTGTTTAQLNITNVVIDSCDFISNYYSPNQNSNGTGLLFGVLNTISTDKIYGYNILLKDNNLNHKNNSGLCSNNINTVGYVLGNNTKDVVIKLVGVSISGCNEGLDPAPRLAGKLNNTGGEQLGSGGYIILADYDSTCAENPNTSAATYANTSSDLSIEAPYVNINPINQIGNSSIVLTGDGLAADTDNLVIKEIVEDASNRYKNALSYIYGDTSKTYLQLYNELSYGTKFSNYNEEQEIDIESDFTVLVIDDFSRANTTQLINTYIGLITNTTYNYGQDTSGIYGVDIYKMTWNQSTSTFDRTNAANMSRADLQFSISPESVDSGGNCFTLIDVKYYNPIDTSKIAYHIYVPVIVKRLLQYDGKIATLSGTDYDQSHYDSERFGKSIMENIGTPITLYIQYHYNYTLASWESLINYGADMSPYYKKLIIEKSTDNEYLTDFPNDTILVLVDRNRNGKAYYARWSDVYNSSSHELILENFKEELDNPSSASFDPISLGELIELTATLDASGKYIVDNNNPTTKAYYNGEWLNLRFDSGSGGTRYSLTVNKTENYIEDYYLSIFTAENSNNVIHNYVISLTDNLHAGVTSDYNQAPTKINGATRQDGVYALLGNIFVQTDTSLRATTVNEEISSENNTLNVEMGTTITLDNDYVTDISPYLSGGDAFSIYQSFLVNLIKKLSISNSAKLVTGNPTVTGSYNIAAANSSIDSRSGNYDTIEVMSTYIEFRNSIALNSFLTTGGGAVITGNFSIQYSGDANISDQFPMKEDSTDRNIGVEVRGTSNLSFEPNKAALSKVFSTAVDSNNKLYYCYQSGNNAKLYYNVRNNIFGGDYGSLGINPLDSNGQTNVNLPSIAVLDISTIINTTADYDKVKVSIKLYSKVDNYTDALTIGNYLSSFNVAGVTSYSTLETGKRLEFIIDRSTVDSSPISEPMVYNDTTIEIPIDFRVRTGTPFENSQFYYSNYKIKLEVELYDGSSPLLSSHATDYLVYTNARILPDFIDD